MEQTEKPPTKREIAMGQPAGETAAIHLTAGRVPEAAEDLVALALSRGHMVSGSNRPSVRTNCDEFVIYIDGSACQALVSWVRGGKEAAFRYSYAMTWQKESKEWIDVPDTSNIVRVLLAVAPQQTGNGSADISAPGAPSTRLGTRGTQDVHLPD